MYTYSFLYSGSFDLAIDCTVKVKRAAKELEGSLHVPRAILCHQDASGRQDISVMNADCLREDSSPKLSVTPINALNT